MIYVYDTGFRKKISPNVQISHCKYPQIYNKCFYLSCISGIDCNVNDNNDYNGEAWSKTYNDKDNIDVNGRRPQTLADGDVKFIIIELHPHPTADVDDFDSINDLGTRLADDGKVNDYDNV